MIARYKPALQSFSSCGKDSTANTRATLVNRYLACMQVLLLQFTKRKKKKLTFKAFACKSIFKIKCILKDQNKIFRLICLAIGRKFFCVYYQRGVHALAGLGHTVLVILFFEYVNINSN